MISFLSSPGLDLGRPFSTKPITVTYLYFKFQSKNSNNSSNVKLLNLLFGDKVFRKFKTFVYSSPVTIYDISRSKRLHGKFRLTPIQIFQLLSCQMTGNLKRIRYVSRKSLFIAPRCKVTSGAIWHKLW